MEQPLIYGTNIELAAACKMYDFECNLLTFKIDKDQQPYEAGLSLMNELEERDKKRKVVRNKCAMMFTGSLNAGHFRFLKPIVPLDLSIATPNGNYDVKQVNNVVGNTLILTHRRRL